MSMFEPYASPNQPPDRVLRIAALLAPASEDVLPPPLVGSFSGFPGELHCSGLHHRDDGLGF